MLDTSLASGRSAGTAGEEGRATPHCPLRPAGGVPPPHRRGLQCPELWLVATSTLRRNTRNSAAAVATPRPADEAKVLIRIRKKRGSPNTETLDLKTNGRSVTLYLMRGLAAAGSAAPLLQAPYPRAWGGRQGVGVQPPLFNNIP